MFDPEIATSSDMKTIDEIAKLAGKCLKMELNKRPEMLEVAERLRKLRKAPQKVQERQALFSWARKNKLAPAKTPSLESSSSSQNVRTFIVRLTVTGLLFEVEDLLRASAELLGKGTVGTTYKATIESGYEIVTKRLKNVQLPNEEFEQHVMMISAIQNKHIVPLQWYYCRTDERLLVYEFIPMGSLAKVLHGDRGFGPSPLDWEQRSAISLAAARGVEYIHLAGPSSCHGNIKSSNILLTGTHDACVSEHGLITLGMYSNAPGYRAPEVTRNRWVSQESNVYSFGILLLELLTRKSPLEKRFQDNGGVDLPRWVCSITPEEWRAEVFDVELLARGQKDGKEECMVRLMQLGLKCCSQDADSRPTMSDVVQRIEEIGQS
ncbi:unnamed protein product [Triticum turgidum subsp. durum]|uniref:Protein kinase domain-containing protein n=1 Tax=Triticum turgidum subsp. durum TaxID=4567 RepID=A0A9R1Q1N9_TRITD|nr:unnamed protein product [Triticum turgidum subsp. durum]